MGNRNDGLNAQLYCLDELINSNFKPVSLAYVADGYFFRSHHPKIKEIRFSGPATIVFFEDGSKQVVKYSDEDCAIQDNYVGVLWALAEKCSVGPYKKFRSKNQLVKFVSEYFGSDDSDYGLFYGLWHIVYNEFIENGPYANADELNEAINWWIGKKKTQDDAWSTFLKELYNWNKEN